MRAVTDPLSARVLRALERAPRSSRLRALTTLVLAAALAACSSTPAPTDASDTGSASPDVVDVGNTAMDAADVSDATAPDTAVPVDAMDAPASEAGGDVALPTDGTGGDARDGSGGDGAVDDVPTVCDDFNAFFVATNSCIGGTTANYSLCVSQTGCRVSITLSTGSLTGVVSGDTLTAAGTVDGVAWSCSAVHSTTGGISMDCTVAGTTSTCTLAGFVPSSPGTSQTCCNAVTQNCRTSADRCSVLNLGSYLEPVCVPTTGARTEGQTCTLNSTTLNDDCAAGLLCTAFTEADGMTRCRRYCNLDSQCPGGNVCVYRDFVTHAGSCTLTPPCDPFAATSSCASGQACNRIVFSTPATSSLRSNALCTAAGTIAPNDLCGGSIAGSCGAGYACARNVYAGEAQGHCRALCDDAHACTGSGEHCATWTRAPGINSFGFCTAL